MSKPKPEKAVRLTFSYDGDVFTLVEETPVEMIIPPADPAGDDAASRHAGLWVDVINPGGHRFYQKQVEHQIQRDAEIFSDDAEGSIMRHPVAHPKGTFTVVVPAKGQVVRLFEVGPLPHAAARGHDASHPKSMKPCGQFDLKP